MMHETYIYFSLAGTIFGLLITVGGLVYRVKKANKVKKACDQSTAISNAVLPIICEAEKLSNFTGLEKKAYVMTKATQFALSNKIRFDEEMVSQKIEELINLTRQVNCQCPKKKSQVEKEMRQMTKDWL